MVKVCEETYKTFAWKNHIGGFGRDISGNLDRAGCICTEEPVSFYYTAD